jgi:uncharacterized protein DUF992
MERLVKNIFRAMTTAASIGVLALATQAHAAPAGIKVGVLTCHVESGWGYVIGSSKDMKCSFEPNDGERDRYTGSISKLGVDIGYTSSAVIVWDVVAPSSDVRPGALQGDYAGATASATVGAGIGAHVLLGGFDKSIALQPVSVEGSTGLDVAAGIGEMRLRKAEIMPVAERFEESAEAGPPEGPPPEEAPLPRERAPLHHHVRHHHHRAYCPPK